MTLHPARLAVASSRRSTRSALTCSTRALPRLPDLTSTRVTQEPAATSRGLFIWRINDSLERTREASQHHQGPLEGLPLFGSVDLVSRGIPDEQQHPDSRRDQAQLLRQSVMGVRLCLRSRACCVEYHRRPPIHQGTEVLRLVG